MNLTGDKSMNLIKLMIVTAIIANANFALAGAKSSCVVKAQDPVIQSFYRSKGFEVDDEKGDFQVAFEVTCEAIDKRTENFSKTEIHQTTTKLEVFNEYVDQRVVYHSEEDVKSGGRVISALMVPCLDTKAAKQKLLERSLKSLENINCSEDDE